MRLTVISIFSIFLVGCVQKAIPMANANGSLIWASGHTEEFYMPGSRRNISFMTNNGLVIYERIENTKDQPCELFYSHPAKLKICENGEATLILEGKVNNTGFVNLYNGARLRHTDNEWTQGTEKASSYITK